MKGKSRSCGCEKRDNLAAKHTTHGMNRSPTHYSWLNMISRCRHSSNREFHNYGGRGIKVLEEWQGSRGFARFLAYMGERPEGKTLDRVDPNGDYVPGNVRWASVKEQSFNKRNTKILTYQGVTRPLVEWADLLGIKRSCLHMRLYSYGWSVGEALGFEPR